MVAPRDAAAGGGGEAEQELARFAGARERTLAMAAGVSQERLDRAPGPAVSPAGPAGPAAAAAATSAVAAAAAAAATSAVGGRRWSPGEVLDHLLLAERFYRGEMERLIELARSGRPAELRRSFADLDISVAFIPRPLLPLLEPPLAVANLFLPAALRDLMTRHAWVPAQNPTVATPRRGRPGDELRADLAASLAATRALFAANPGLDFSRMVHYHPLLGSNTVPRMLRFMTLHEQRHQDQLAAALGGEPGRGGGGEEGG